MDFLFKEVYYKDYCPKCKYWENDEWSEPCDDCLSKAGREYSHKPEHFKPKDEENKK